MMDHICPQHIQDLWNNHSTRLRANGELANWLGSLDLKDGDRVWVPDVGFLGPVQIAALRAPK